MTFYIRARDAAGCLTLRRDIREAAAKKAEELKPWVTSRSRLPKKPRTRPLNSLRQRAPSRWAVAVPRLLTDPAIKRAPLPGLERHPQERNPLLRIY